MITLERILSRMSKRGQRLILQQAPLKELAKNMEISAENVEFLLDLHEKKNFKGYSFQLNSSYFSSILKKFISENENNQEAEDIVENCYEVLGCLMSRRHKEVEANVEKIFIVQANDMGDQNDFPICIVEDKATISQGTTGLSTWGASLYLLEYLSRNPSIISGKNLMELGSGCGLLGLGCAALGASNVLMTDISELVLDRIQINISRNKGLHHKVSVSRLDWANVDLKPRGDLDMVLAADVVFDPSIIPELVDCISKLGLFCLMSLTERNKDTLELFMTEIRKAGLQITTIQFAKQEALYYYAEETPIHLFNITPSDHLR